MTSNPKSPMFVNLHICVLAATALQGDEGKEFLLSIKVDGCDRGTHVSRSEVALSDMMVWLPKGKEETDSNTNEFDITIEQFSSITFELRSASSSQVLSSTGPLIARFTTTMHDLCCQREKRSLDIEFVKLSESFVSGSQVAVEVGSRELYLSWMLRGRLPQAAKGFGGQYPPQWFDTKDSDPSMAIRRCLLVMKPEAKVSIINCMHWMPVGIERGARFRNPENIPYILSRAFELNKVYEATGAALLTPRDLDIPSIRVYIKVVKPDLQPIHKIKFKTSYSKLTFVERLDQADIWIVESKGQHYGRIVHELEFMDASKPRLHAAFAQILPLFRLMLQLWGTLEVYVGPPNLMELESLENGPGLKVPGNIWYSFSWEGCFICDEAIPGDTTERMDFGGLVPHEQRVLPLGRDAIEILSHHFTSLSAFPQKSVPEVSPRNIVESTQIPEVPRNTSTCMDSYDSGIFDMKLVTGA